jgi:hypothetical protein
MAKWTAEDKERGVIEIAHALEHNRSLQSLDLADNHICDTGGVALAKVLLHNKCLKRLVLQHNKDIGDKTVVQIAKSLLVVYKNPHFGKPLIKLMVGDMDVDTIGLMMEKKKFHVRAGGEAIEYSELEVEVFKDFAAELPSTMVSHVPRYSLLTEKDESAARQKRAVDTSRSTALTSQEEQDVRDAHSLPQLTDDDEPCSNPAVFIYWQDLEFKTTDKLGEAAGIAKTVSPKWEADASGKLASVVQKELLTDEDKKGENRVLIFEVSGLVQ